MGLEYATPHQSATRRGRLKGCRGYYDIPIYSFKEEHQLPIRLVLSGPVPLLEIGMLYIPEDILNAQPEKTVTIITSQEQLFEYSFERLNPQTTTYLNVGTEPSKQYRVIAPSALYAIAMLKRLKVMVPDSKSQEQFATFVSQVDKSKVV